MELTEEKIIYLKSKNEAGNRSEREKNGILGGKGERKVETWA